MNPNYVVGRGKLYFGQFAAGTRFAQGQLYFGNTPELTLAQEEDVLDHYSMEGGARVKDASVTLQQDSSGSFTCDNISAANLALWFRGTVESRTEVGSTKATGTVTFANAPAAGDTVTINGTVFTFVAANPVGTQLIPAANATAQATAFAAMVNTVTAATGVTAAAAAGVVTLTAAAAGVVGNAITLAEAGTDITVSGATLTGGADVSEDFDAIYKGRHYQLGVTAETPQGLRDVTGITVAGLAATSYTADPITGRLFIHEDAPDVIDGMAATVSYGVNSRLETTVIAKGESIEGELQFLADNAHGANDDYYWPYVRLTPDGDFSLIGDDWSQVTFTFEILKRDATTQRQIINRR